MSGLEPLVAIGLASNNIQFVDFTTQLCARIKEICNSSSGLPKELEKQANQLSGLSSVLKDLAQHPEGLTLAHGVLEQCRSDAQELELLLKRFEGGWGRGLLKNAKLAYHSLRPKPEIEKLQMHLDRLVSILSLQIQIRTESSVSEVVKVQKAQLAKIQQMLDWNTVNAKVSEQFKPIWMVPIGRNPNFVGREEIFKQLENKLLGQSSEYQRIAVLHGLGGIGKSQIALEYIFRNKSSDTAVFWVHASSTTRFMDSYKRIASECQLPGGDDATADVAQVVRDWLDIKCPFEWFMVVDNVDDRADFLERSEHCETKRALCEYIPQSARGTILYTTRSRDIGIDLSPDKDPIMVQCFGFDDARALLGEGLVSDTPKDDQVALFDDLDYLPLAISQAAAFMIKRRKRVADYLILIRDDSTRSQILSRKGYHHGRTERSSESVVSTWWVTFRSIKKENTRAAELLTMMSLLDRHEIPVSMLQDPEEGTFDFEEAIGLLEDFSLISTFSSVNSCRKRALEQLKQMTHDTRKPFVFGGMHRLVQESTKAWLSQSDGNATDIAMKTLERIGRCFETTTEKTQLCILLYPHLNASLYYNSEMFETSEKSFDDRPDEFSYRIDMLHELCYYSLFQLKSRQSEQHIRLAMSMCKTHLGDHHERTLNSMELYSFVCYSTGKIKEACAIQYQVMRVHMGSLGYHHPKTLSAMSKLGQLSTSTRNLGQAERLLGHCLSEQLQNLLESPEDEQTQQDYVRTIKHLASVFVEKGQHQRALDLLDEADKREDMWQEDYQQCSSSTRIELARYFCHCGKYQDAHSLIEAAFERERRFFGAAHLDSFYLRHELVTIIWAEGRYDEAEELMKGLFEDMADIDNAESQQCIHVLLSIGEMQYSRGKFAEAEITFRRILPMVIHHGQEWFSISEYSADRIQQDIRQCLEFQGKSKEGKTYLLPPEQKPALGTENPSEGNTLMQKGKSTFAESSCGKVMTTSMSKTVVPIKSSGSDESHTEQAINDLARSLLDQHKYEEAYQLGQYILAWTKCNYGWRHPETLSWNLLLAVSSESLGKLDQSEHHWRQLLYWQNYRFRHDSFIVVKAHNAIAKLIARRRDYEAAEQACKRGLAIHPAHLEKVCPRLVADTKFILGSALMLQRKYEESETKLRLAYTRCVEVFGSYDVDSVYCLKLLTLIAKQTGNIDRTEELYYLLGETSALPSDGEEEDFDDSASESDCDGVKTILLSDGEEDFDDSASESDHDSDSSGWETTTSDPDHNRGWVMRTE